MKPGRTFVAIRDEGIIKRGMTFSFLTYENDFIYLWSHQPILSMHEFKFPKEAIERNFRIV